MASHGAAHAEVAATAAGARLLQIQVQLAAQMSFARTQRLVRRVGTMYRANTQHNAPRSTPHRA